MSLNFSVPRPSLSRAAACVSISVLMAAGLAGCNRSTPDSTTTTTTTTPPMAPASAASR